MLLILKAVHNYRPDEDHNSFMYLDNNMAPAFHIHVITQMSSRQAGIRRGREAQEQPGILLHFIDTIRIKWEGRNMRKEALQLALPCSVLPETAKFEVKQY